MVEQRQELHRERTSALCTAAGASSKFTKSLSVLRVQHQEVSVSAGGARLPIHLAHPRKDEHAVVIHALGPSLQGSRQNRGEPCRLFPSDTPSRGSVVVTTRRLGTINTMAPFNHVEIDLQNAPLAEDEFGHRYQCEL